MNEDKSSNVEEVVPPVPIEPLDTTPEEEQTPIEQPVFVPPQEPVTVSKGSNPLLLGLTIVVVFLLGLGIGFFGRPAVLQDVPIEVVVTVVPNENQAVAQADSSAATQPSEAPAAEAAQSEGTNGSAAMAEDHNNEGQAANSAPTPTIMDFVMSDARHIQGDDIAPITIIEFSDFN